VFLFLQPKLPYAKFVEVGAIVLPDISPRRVTGRKELAATPVPFLLGRRLAKPSMRAPLSPSYEERMPAGR
jgi:hypothetical protein